jgi:uncharacterized protein YjbI with pentapeptide repeats
VLGSYVGADFTDADFEQSKMEGSFQYAIFRGADLSEASFVQQLRGVDAYLGADFTDANFSRQRISQAGFTNASFRGANLSDVSFDNDVRFFGNDFRQANLERTRFKGRALEFADVRQVDFTTMSGATPRLFGAKYDQFTIFRDTNFDPVAEGMEYVPAIPGDTNLDDQISFDDFLLLSDNFGSSCAGTDLDCWQRGDFDLDGLVGFADFLLQAANLTEANALGATSVPEPKAVRILLAGLLLGLALLRRLILATGPHARVSDVRRTSASTS